MMGGISKIENGMVINTQSYPIEKENNHVHHRRKTRIEWQN